MNMIKKSIKNALSVLTGALLICTLSACHGSKGLKEFEIPAEFDESKNYEITFWAKNDTNVNQTRIYEKAISDFEALYPNIKISLRLYTDYGRIYNDVITNISTNTTPNVCITYPDHIATYMTGMNTVVPLDELLTASDYGMNGRLIKFEAPSADEIVPEFLEECRIGEHYYALPYMRSTEACYINKTYVEKLGYEVPDMLTWDYIWEVSDAATKKDKDGNYLINSQKVMIPFIYKSTDNMMIQMLKQYGGGYSDEDGSIYIFNDTTREILKEISKHVDNGAFSTFKISSYPANFLDAGQCIFAIDSTAGSTWMGSKAPLSDISADKVVEFETAVRPVPQFDVNAPKMISQGPSVCIFNKADSGEVLASWLFTQYLLTNDVQIAYAETEGYVPVTSKAQNSDEYREYLGIEEESGVEHYEIKLKATKLLLSNIDNTFFTPDFNGSASLRDAAGQMIENVAKSIRRKEKVDDDYFDKLYADIKALYRLEEAGSRGANAETSNAEDDLGRLPIASVMLIVSLVTAWAIMGGITLYKYLLKKQ